jgi:hypothetical protein
MNLLAALILSTAPQAAADDLDRKIRAVLPRPEEERWLKVPWELNLMKARLESQEAGKPLLVWIMDGNVLGCT